MATARRCTLGWNPEAVPFAERVRSADSQCALREIEDRPIRHHLRRLVRVPCLDLALRLHGFFHTTAPPFSSHASGQEALAWPPPRLARLSCRRPSSIVVFPRRPGASA